MVIVGEWVKVKSEENSESGQGWQGWLGRLDG